jgi:hypothetical protein
MTTGGLGTVSFVAFSPRRSREYESDGVVVPTTAAPFRFWSRCRNTALPHDVCSSPGRDALLPWIRQGEGGVPPSSLLRTTPTDTLPLPERWASEGGIGSPVLGSLGFSTNRL